LQGLLNNKKPFAKHIHAKESLSFSRAESFVPFQGSS